MRDEDGGVSKVVAESGGQQTWNINGKWTVGVSGVGLRGVDPNGTVGA